MKLARAARAVLILLLSLGACQTGTPPVADDLETIGQGTQRVAITFSIAQGMAKSYVGSGRATPVDLLTLVRYDQAALAAIRGHVANPSWTSLATAAAAVSALMDYTTTMDARAADPISSRAAAAR